MTRVTDREEIANILGDRRVDNIKYIYVYSFTKDGEPCSEEETSGVRIYLQLDEELRDSKIRLYEVGEGVQELEKGIEIELKERILVVSEDTSNVIIYIVIGVSVTILILLIILIIVLVRRGRRKKNLNSMIKHISKDV